MAFKVTLRLYPGATEREVGAILRASVLSAAGVAKGLAQGRVRDEGRVHTGRMAENIEIGRVEGPPLNPRVIITATEPHAIFQEEGTRAHGPVTARFLRFVPKGQSGVVFARWVRGVVGIHFMRRAAESLTPADFLPKL